jgi:hypothetical protein
VEEAVRIMSSTYRRRYGGGVAALKCEKRGVRFGLNEPNGTGIGGETLEPCSRCLFEAIEGFKNLTHMIRIVSIDKPRGLLTVYNLVEISMEKGVFNIELMHGPRLRKS